MPPLLPLSFALAALIASVDDAPPEWTDADTRAVLEKTLELRFAPDLSRLAPAERVAVEHLLAAGEVVQELYEEQRHRRAAEARAWVAEHGTDDERALFRLFEGPIGTTLDNRRAPFLDVDASVPGRNVYPWGVARDELEGAFADRPERRDALLHLRSVVRRRTPENVLADREALRRRPALAALHPEFERSLVGLAREGEGPSFYAVPYAVRFAPALDEVRRRLRAAAAALDGVDDDLAQMLRLRATDLLTDDYEAGDAAWVTGSFGNLNAQIGAYETYDDALFGVKAFFGLSLLVKDAARSAKLKAAISGLQEIEDALPIDRHARVRDDIPVGVYEVVADFGQARGTNTATILPNEGHLARKYGRTILLRANVLTDPELFGLAEATWRAAVHPDHHGELALDGNFHRTLWHEIGHSLGPRTTADGRSVDAALEEHSDVMEELKSDLVSLFAAPRLRAAGYHDDASLRAVMASGILRVLQKVKPRRAQPYQTMQLMQWNWFRQNGVLSLVETPDGPRLAIDHARYDRAVAAMLHEVLGLQSRGDKRAVARFVDALAVWEEEHHGAIAASIRGAERYRYRLVRYAALGE